MSPKFSQNFLDNPGVAKAIAAAVMAAPGDFTVEIGPGKGVLTRLLAGYGQPFTAIEIDRGLVEYLAGKPDIMKYCSVVNADFMKADLGSLLPLGRKVRFAGNLPYDAGTAIVQRVLECPGFSSGVFMLQKEVCERIVAAPGTGKYGLLALSVQSRARARIVLKVGRLNFRPVPAVDSAVVEIVRLDSPLLAGAAMERAFFTVIRAAFTHRRKTILNSMSIGLCRPKEAVEPLLAGAGIAPNSRAETVPLAKYLELAGRFLSLQTKS